MENQEITLAGQKALSMLTERMAHLESMQPDLQPIQQMLGRMESSLNEVVQRLDRLEAAPEPSEFAWVDGSWWQLLLLTGILAGLYFGLQFMRRLVVILGLRPGTRRPLENVLRKASIVFEPIALLMLLVAFLRINPLIHGATIALALLGTFHHVRNYLEGRLILLENKLRVGEAVSVGTVRGRLIRMGRLGMKIRHDHGLHHLGYHQLLQSGYVLESGSESGEFYRLKLRPREQSERSQYHQEALTQFLGTAPYVDWTHLPELTSTDEENTWLARVQVREETHLKDLLRLMQERGYDCETIVNNGS